ncbi:MAG: FG-GAP-like repeat-containing protein, partial [Gaiellaceae bacterium]
EHGDWWRMHGWWIFAGTAAVALLSKYLIRFRGRHVFNPSNAGLVLCFLLLGPERADPLALWWGPMSAWMVLALAIIVTGGLVILSRLGLLGLAVGFWLAFAAGIAVLAVAGHEMTARWHLGPITGFEFWRVLVFSPEILVFLFFMITDPKTIPDGRTARRVYAVAVGLLTVLLIAPQTTEFATKTAVLGALTLACAARPLFIFLQRTSLARSAPRLVPARRPLLGVGALVGATAFAALLVLAGLPARPGAAAAGAPVASSARLPEVTVVPSTSVSTTIDDAEARRIARDVLRDLRVEAEALRLRDRNRAKTASSGARLQGLWQQIDAAEGDPIVVPEHAVARLRLTLEVGAGQGPPLVLAELAGTETLVTYEGTQATVVDRSEPRPLDRTLELQLDQGRYLIVGARGAVAAAPGRPAAPAAAATGIGAVRLRDVAAGVGIDFRHGAFRYQVTTDQVPMMGAGVCWLDYDGDGRLDLYAVNSYTDLDFSRFEQAGGLPRNGLFHNVGGRFEDVSRGSGADLALRANGCVAADFDGDNRTDLYVTAAGYDALLWNDGDGTFTEGARAAGIADFGWHAGAAVADVNGDGLQDLFVTGYTDVNAPIPGSEGGFPTDHQAVRDRLYLNEGAGKNGRSRFREVGLQAGIEKTREDHGLGAVFTDVTGDGRADLYVANDADPNRLYVNVPVPGGATADSARLGFRLEDRGREAGVADPNAGMGIAVADYDLDGRADLFVTNSHRQLHAAYRGRPPVAGRPSFADARPAFAQSLDTTLAGWGASWADLDLDGDPDLVLANGAIPVSHLAQDAEPLKVLANLAAQGKPGQVADVSRLVLGSGTDVIGRGLAVADYDDDGDLDVAVNSVGGRLQLLENTGAHGSWLEVRLKRFAPGAIVTAVLPDGRRLRREVIAGSSYLSSEDPRVHFGLGDATVVRELLVRYPGGGESRLMNVKANQIITV